MNEEGIVNRRSGELWRLKCRVAGNGYESALVGSDAGIVRRLCGEKWILWVVVAPAWTGR